MELCNAYELLYGIIFEMKILFRERSNYFIFPDDYITYETTFYILTIDFNDECAKQC